MILNKRSDLHLIHVATKHKNIFLNSFAGKFIIMAEQAVAQHLIKAAEVIESQLDAEINKLDNLDEDEMEVLRRRRIDALKRQQEKKQEWASNGHGLYTEVPGEKEFFSESKKSENVVVHFYR